MKRYIALGIFAYVQAIGSGNSPAINVSTELAQFRRLPAQRRAEMKRHVLECVSMLGCVLDMCSTPQHPHYRATMQEFAEQRDTDPRNLCKRLSRGEDVRQHQRGNIHQPGQRGRR